MKILVFNFKSLTLERERAKGLFASLFYLFVRFRESPNAGILTLCEPSLVV